jgi:aminotransferase
VTSAIRKVHDFLTVGAPCPLQHAGAVALRLPESYYAKLAAAYLARRDRSLAMLEAAGFKCFKPRGAYYIMTDISAFLPRCGTDDVSFTRHMIENIGVAPVPGSSFYNNPADGSRQVRFCFCKTDATLSAAEARLRMLRP